VLPQWAKRAAGSRADLLAIAAALAERFELAGNGAVASAASAGRRSRPADPFESLAGWRHPGLGGAAS
jgi:hypothetical protein